MDLMESLQAHIIIETIESEHAEQTNHKKTFKNDGEQKSNNQNEATEDDKRHITDSTEFERPHDSEAREEEKSPIDDISRHERSHGREAAEHEKKVFISQEQLMKIKIPLPEQINVKKTDNTHLIIVADTSGSMSGNPIEQVKSAVKEIVESTLDIPCIITDLIKFNTEAKVVGFDATDYNSKVDKLKGGGGTSFSAAFEVITSQIKHVQETKGGLDIQKTVIVFLTDGMDSYLYSKSKGDIDIDSTWFRNLIKGLDATEAQYTIHTVGFSREHHFGFLKRLTEMGSGEGMFRYCEPEDGSSVLKEKLQELFDFVLDSSCQSQEIAVKIDEENKVVDNGKLQNACTLKGELAISEENKRELLVETWIYMKDSTALPVLDIELILNKMQDNEKIQNKIKCAVSIEQKKIESSMDKILWNIKILQRNTDILSAAIGKAVSTNKVKDNFGSRIDKLQDRVSRTPLFKKFVDKEMRDLVKKHLDDIQTKINHMRSVLAEYARGDTGSVQMLARAHDMRYQAKFTKSRRQRIMDKRAAKNLSVLKTAQTQLDQLTINKEEIERISKDSEEFYFCALSQDSIKDILLDQDRDNAMGFGLAVRRQEHILDAPSLIQVCNISRTLVSRKSMLDALEYKINCQGQLSAHGGFDFNLPLGVTTVGQSREPINAWLPLYCTRSHWERVKNLIKPSLGYFCTLDPLGYDYKQLDVMFMLLGSMIGQLSDTHSSEHQIKMTFCFMRTCQACAEDFLNVDTIVEDVKKFLNNPQDRMKHKVPNLFTIVGYIASLPKDKLKLVMDMNGEGKKMLWLAMLSECLRRAAGKMLREVNQNVIHGIIDLILHGSGPANEVPSDQAFATLVNNCMAQTSTRTDLPLTTVFDPKEGLKIVSDVTGKHDEKVDKAMEIWAQAELGIIKNKNQMEKVLAAKKSVSVWLEEGQKLVSVEEQPEEPNETDKKQFDMCEVNSSNLLSAAQIAHTLTNGAYPNLRNMLGCMAFVDYLLAEKPDFSDMDNSDGIPPDAWISGVKEAVRRVYSCMNDQLKACTSVNENDSDVLVVTDTGTDRTDSHTVVMDTDTKQKSDSTTDIEDDENSGDDNDDFDDDFSGDEDDYTRTAKVKKKDSDKKGLCVPILCRMIDPDYDTVHLTRILICQAIQYHSNSRARSAVEEGIYVDLAREADYKAELQKLYAVLRKMRDDAILCVIESVKNKRANHCMLHTPSIWAFVGYLMNTYKERSQGFSELISEIMNTDADVEYPFLDEKIRILFLGKYKDNIVIAKGNVWIPEKKISIKLAQVLGEEVWINIETEIRSNVQLHIYRESDIPNRHGHCNSNPYIPNALRMKLGMPLLAIKGSRRKKLR